MSTISSRQSWIVSLAVISLMASLHLPPQATAAEELLKKKAETGQGKTISKIEQAAQKQTSKEKEAIKPSENPASLPVKPIIEEMKRASNLIKNQKTGKETQKVQQQVVQNLDELIRLIESAPRGSRSRPNPNNDPQAKDGKKSQQKKSETGQKKSPQLSQGPARQSSDRKDKGEATAGSLKTRSVYIKEAWGHLPPAMRQQLLNIYTEKFLPQYEDQVRRYYEALAEQKKDVP